MLNSTQSAQLKSFKSLNFSCNFAASAIVKIDVNKFFKIISIRWIFSVYQGSIQKQLFGLVQRSICIDPLDPHKKQVKQLKYNLFIKKLALQEFSLSARLICFWLVFGLLDV
jgi:hypothetical protein